MDFGRIKGSESTSKMGVKTSALKQVKSAEEDSSDVWGSSSKVVTARALLTPNSVLESPRVTKGLELPAVIGKLSKYYEFQFRTCTDPVNDDPGLMLEIYLKDEGQVAEVYCEGGVIKADIFKPTSENDRFDEWPEIERQLASALASGRMTIQGWIDQDNEESTRSPA